MRATGHLAVIPALYVHPCCAIANLWPIEDFHDHARVQHLLFDGALTPVEGKMRPDLSRSGLGIELKRADAARNAV